jgi:glycosyltransferase involved in cell wall biosynthesis
MTTISICIFARNEEENIGKLIKQLSNQTLFGDHDHIFQLIVANNGSSDRTGSIAAESIEANFTDSLYWRVLEVEQPGKSNAWNVFVQKAIHPDSEYLVFMDADIDLCDRSVLKSMISKLESEKDLWVCLDNPIKDVDLKSNPTIMERISSKVSKSSNKGQFYICGQLYAIRTSVARNIVLPIGLTNEDGFLTQVIITEWFTVKDADFGRIARTDGFHVFKAVTKPIDLINHEVRVSTGIVVNDLLTKFLTVANEPSVAYIDRLNREDANWLNDFVRNRFLWEIWRVPMSLVFRRFRSLQSHSIPSAIVYFPVACLAFLVDLVVFWQVNKRLRSGNVANFW